jgi:hypothetical protein
VGTVDLVQQWWLVKFDSCWQGAVLAVTRKPAQTVFAVEDCEGQA